MFCVLFFLWCEYFVILLFFVVEEKEFLKVNDYRGIGRYKYDREFG